MTEQPLDDMLKEALQKILPSPLDQEMGDLVMAYQAEHNEITKHALRVYLDEIQSRVERLTFFGDITEEDARKLAVQEGEEFKAALNMEVFERLKQLSKEHQQKVQAFWERANDQQESH